jgi:hypothetical protein
VSRCRGSAECERKSFHARIEKLDLELPSGPHNSEASIIFRKGVTSAKPVARCVTDPP